ncbi:MAG: ankyrin repeat domain-containing protein [Spirochaetaceae bacterium]|jgi:ankyrin repeat protein|nr:ankyrin repeat domain-containing protein [Spirochaetaceae bacterium]
MELRRLFFKKDRESAKVVVFFIGCCFIFFNMGVNCFAGGKKEAAPAPPKQAAAAPEPSRDKTAVRRLGDLIAAGKTEEAKTFFFTAMSVNDTDSDGKSALHFAALNRSSELADFFIKLGTLVDTADNEGDTPLNLSARVPDAKTSAVLAAAGANIHHRPSMGDTPAQIAVRPENAAYLDALLTPASLVSTDEDGKTILRLAVDTENTVACDTILRAARDARGAVLQEMLGKKDKDGKSALDVCFSKRGSKNAASMSAAIITAGGTTADPFYPYFAPAIRTLNFNQRSSTGISPLHFAVREKYSGWVDYLLEKNADPNIKSTSGATPLIEAARIGDLDTMRKLLDKGANPNIQDAQGNTAMHVAIPEEAHRAALELLLSKNGNPNIRDERGDSPAHIVIDLNRSADVLEVLLSRGADVTIYNIEGKTPLFVAVEKERSALIPVLLKYRSDIFAVSNQGVTPFEKALQAGGSTLDEMITEDTVQRSDNGGNTPLIAAVKMRAHIDIIRRILDRNAKVNARNQEGDTALHNAVRQNDAAAGDLLISRGANIFLQNSKGESPLSLTFSTRGGVREWMFIPVVLEAADGQGRTVLHYAAEQRLDQAIANIVSRGAAVDAQNVLGETPLFIAVRINSASTVRALLQAGANINGRDSLGNTALHIAVRYESLAAAEALIAAGIDINTYNLNNSTALHEAVKLGKYPIASLLVQRKTNLELRDADGNTPLECAVISGNYRMTELLVRSKADVNTRNNDGVVPLLIAVRGERSDLVALLLDNQAQIHARDADGESPFTAALGVSLRMALSLLSKGRDQTDDEGRSPLHIALMMGRGQVEIEAITGWVGDRQLVIVDRQGKTPLRYAVDLKNWIAAKYLTEQGSNVFSQARDSLTPAEVVIMSGDKEAVRALFGGRAISSSDAAGNTALHYAARIGSTDIISFLLEIGANRGTRNTSGDLPADIALRWGRSEQANMLR